MLNDTKMFISMNIFWDWKQWSLVAINKVSIPRDLFYIHQLSLVHYSIHVTKEKFQIDKAPPQKKTNWAILYLQWQYDVQLQYDAKPGIEFQFPPFMISDDNL
jgi:hypothetical protein